MTAPSDSPPASSPTARREHLANERTLLAWIRTGLAFAAFGTALAKAQMLLDLLRPATEGAASAPHSWAPSVLGIALLIVGAFVPFVGLRRYRAVASAIGGGEAGGDGALVVFGGAVTVLALALALYVALD